MCSSVSPMPMCVWILMSGDPETACQLHCQQTEPQTQSSTLALPVYPGCPAPVAWPQDGRNQENTNARAFFLACAPLSTSSGLCLKSAVRPDSVQRHQNDLSSRERKPWRDILTSLSRTMRQGLGFCRHLQPRDPTSRCGTF